MNSYLSLKHVKLGLITVFCLTHGLMMSYHMVTKIWVHFGSGNGLLPDGTKPSPEPSVSPAAFTWGQQVSQRYISAINH